MIEPIISRISNNLKSLPFIERHGGLVRTARRYMIIDGQPFEELYPVSMDVEGNCFENGKYLDLAPNSSYKSVSYFEQRGPVIVECEGSFYKFTAPVSFVCWMNMKKVGSHNQVGYVYEGMSLDVLTKSIQINKYHALSVEIESLHPKNEGIFQKYNYSDRLDLFLYPYDFFSINFIIKWRMQIGCFDGVINDPIC